MLADVVIRECPFFVELFAGEDEALVGRWYPIFLPNLRLDGVDGIRILDVQNEGLAGLGFHQDLHVFLTMMLKACLLFS